MASSSIGMPLSLHVDEDDVDAALEGIEALRG
jgi:hypothetical protein